MKENDFAYTINVTNLPESVTQNRQYKIKCYYIFIFEKLQTAKYLAKQNI